MQEFGDLINSMYQNLFLFIQTKITEPSSEGTAGQVLTTDGNGGRSWTTVSVDVATIAETQAIIDEYRKDDDEVVTFETEFVSTGTEGFVTVEDAEDITAAYTSGKTVRIHFPPSQEARNYSVYEGYADLVAYDPPYTDGQNPIPEKFHFAEMYAGGNIILDNPTVTEQGKLFFIIYVD